LAYGHSVKNLLTWQTAGYEIRVLTFHIHLISSEYGFKHNLHQVKELVYLRLAYCLWTGNATGE